MMITGSGRIVGTVVAGHVASGSLIGVFGYAAALCVAAGTLFFFALHDQHTHTLRP